MSTVTRTVVVTGSASGIGRAVSELLRSRGYHVLGVDRQHADIISDLSTDAGCAEMVAQVTEATGGTLDVAIANAGVTAPDALCYAVNYHGAVRTLTGLRPLLERSPAPRAVITASLAAASPHNAEAVAALEAGLDTPPGTHFGEGYITSKYAIAHWVRTTAVVAEWAGKNILLNAICPGLVETPMQAEASKQQSVQQMMQAIPLRRTAQPSELAEVFAFLASEANTYISGQLLYVDGGLEAMMRPNNI